jgi:hypothetical protein
MNKTQKLMLYTALLLSAVSLACSFMLFPVTVVTRDTNEAFTAAMSKFMWNSLRELSRNSDRVRFAFPSNSFGRVENVTPDPRFPDEVYPDWRNDFVLSIGESFKGRPDHHSGSTYTLKGIESAGVVIAYESRFDHRSFGKNRISVNRGELRLQWKDGQQSAALVSGSRGTPPAIAGAAPQDPTGEP